MYLVFQFRFVLSQKEEFIDDFDDSYIDVFSHDYKIRKRKKIENIRKEKLDQLDINK